MNASPTNALNLSTLLHPRTRREVWTRLIIALALIVGFMTAYTGMRSARAAFNPVPGTLISGSVNSTLAAAGPLPTLPRGVVWLADASAAGGHWWVGDQVLGLCRMDPVAVNNSGPFALSLCDRTVLSGGGIVSGTVPGDATAMYLYVGDTSAKSITVVRYKITGVNTATPTFGSKNPMKVPNVTQNGGGTLTGRPTALALFNSPTAALPNKQDLLVGYIKSGDVMRVSDANETTSNAPTVTKIGSTSDGIGVNSFVKVGNDLYLAEVGGLGGVSKIADPLGVTHPACSPTAVCSAITVGSSISFPGGMAYDGSRFLYVGDVRVGGSTNFVYRLDVTALPATVTLSNSVPTFSAKDSNQIQTSFSSYTFPLALGYRPNGDLYVGGDPQFLAAVVTAQQGHIWKVVTPPPPPSISSLNPSNGAAAGGDVITIAGTNFSTAAGATTVKFGASPAVIATCVTAQSCTVTTPPGSGTVSVVLTTGGGSTDGIAIFTYNAPLGAYVTSISPTFGSANGGDLLTINGSGFTTDNTTSVTFGAGVGGVAGGLATCTSTQQCTVLTPAGAGALDVIVNVGGATPSTSTPVPADIFNYTPVITGVNPASGSTAGGDPVVTVSGSGFVPGATAISFGANAGTGVACAGATTCTVTPPAGNGTVDVKVTVGNQTGLLTSGYSYVIPVIPGPQITSILPSSGSTAGGTVVTINGVNFPIDGSALVRFNGVLATFVTCLVPTQCTVDSPSTTGAGVVSVTLTDPLVVVTPPPSPVSITSNPASFTYVQATASLYAWGITAPKGGAVWLPGALGGHWWSSDHAQGFCRQDLLPSGMHAMNFSVCGDDLVGSAGQGVYDPRPVNTYAADGTTATGNIPNLHYVYVPDNAVKSVAVWRLTFDSNTETMVADPNSPGLIVDPATGTVINDQFASPMAPASDLRTLKPNGMALGPLNASGVFCGLAGAGCSPAQNAAIGLYVTDLVERYVRVISNPDASPRTQVVDLVAATGDGRGSNGTQGFIGNYLYISGNRATQFFDVTLCSKQGFTPPGNAAVCGMASVPAPVGVFVSGTAVDPANKLVYQSDSPGGASAVLLRYDASHDVYVAFPAGSLPADLNGVVHCEAAGCQFGPTAAAFINSGGTLPGPLGGPIVVATGPAGPPAIGAVRPWDLGNHPTLVTKFSFAFGIAVGPSGELIITEDPSAGARSGRGSMWTVPFTG